MTYEDRDRRPRSRAQPASADYVEAGLRKRLEAACINDGATPEAASSAAEQIFRATQTAHTLYALGLGDGTLPAEELKKFGEIAKHAAGISNAYQQLGAEGLEKLNMLNPANTIQSKPVARISLLEFSQFAAALAQSINYKSTLFKRGKGKPKSNTVHRLAIAISEEWRTATGDLPALTKDKVEAFPRHDLFQCVEIAAAHIPEVDIEFTNMISENALLEAVRRYKLSI